MMNANIQRTKVAQLALLRSGTQRQSYQYHRRLNLHLHHHHHHHHHQSNLNSNYNSNSTARCLSSFQNHEGHYNDPRITQTITQTITSTMITTLLGAAVVAAGCTTAAATALMTAKDDHTTNISSSSNNSSSNSINSNNNSSSNNAMKHNTRILNSDQILATSAMNHNHTHTNNPQSNSYPKKTTNNNNNNNNNNNQKSFLLPNEEKASQEYDFIIIGNGNAGRSAMQTLLDKCPTASILIVDPSNYTPIHNQEKQQQQANHVFGSAIGFDHSKQTVDIFTSSTPNHNNNNNNQNNTNNSNNNEKPLKRIKYKHSLLIATGVRASPPPDTLIDNNATERILELRSTQLPSLHQYYMNYSYNRNHNHNDTTSVDYDGGQNQNQNQNNYPVLSRSAVRQIALMASSQGSKVCILGSGIEAVELAASLAEVQRGSRNHTHTTTTTNHSISDNIHGNNTNGNTNGNYKGLPKKRNSNHNTIALMFGSAAPLSNILPRYLSTAVTKRLRTNGVDIEDRSLVRYVSSSSSSLSSSRNSNTNSNSNTNGGIEVHTVKSFDNLDSKRYQADLLVVAPSVSKQQGTAVLPTVTELVHDNYNPVLSFQPWSKLGSSNSGNSNSRNDGSSSSSKQKAISCFSDDGRIVVNSELSAASNIYAAGSVAKYPNHFTGHATVAGEGIVNGALAGVIAAKNMAKEYNCRINNVDVDVDENENEDNTFMFSQEEDLPIFRTDKLSTSGDHTSSLSSLGIHALCVGQCDSENMSTHGFWWTNQSLQNRRLSRRMSNVNSNANANANDVTARNNKKEKSRSPRAVYGSGVVFYLDRSASIRGVMIWGLPFTTTTTATKSKSKGNQDNDLNEKLMNRIQSIIHSNGKIMIEDYQNIVKEMNLDSTLLSQSHLSQESRLLATLAISGATTSNKDISSNLSNSRPLHRFIPSKPINVANMGVLKRTKPIGSGGVGDDIFERNNHELGSDETARHPSLVHYFSYDWSSSRPTPLDDEEDIKEREEIDETNRISSRPPKEEPLWLRKNETMRTVSLSDKMTEMFAYNLKRGQFYDGNDAVKQAPTPEFVERWVGENNVDKDDDDR